MKAALTACYPELGITAAEIGTAGAKQVRHVAPCSRLARVC
jgi:hypothetical protein